jgi:integrase
VRTRASQISPFSLPIVTYDGPLIFKTGPADMPTRALTTAAIARIPAPKTGQEDHFDRGYPGLALRISYGGARAWVYFYRHAGKLRRLSFGRWPAMGLAEARDAWREARKAVDRGENPARQRPSDADAVASVVADWLRRDQGPNRSVAEVERIFRRDVLPGWEGRQIGTITRLDVVELIDAVADRGAVVMARRLHSHLHRLFMWCLGRGLMENHPMVGLGKPGEESKRDRVLDDREIAAIWQAAGRVGWPFGEITKLLVLLGARRAEVGGLRWEEIVGNEVRLGAARTKSGEARVIPLSAAAVAIIEALPRIDGEYVFSTTGRTPVSGWSKAKLQLDRAIADNGSPIAGWVIHDLRRSVATGMQRIGIGLQVIEEVLGHIGGSRAGIVGVYQRHSFEAEKRVALEAWSREVQRIIGRETGAVVPMRPRGA